MLTATSAITARHPHAHTLELLQLAVDRLPPLSPKSDTARFQKRKDAFVADPAASYAAIHDLIVEIGKRSWARRKAYEELYARYGRASEEAHLLEHLDAGVRTKYEQFIHDGGKIEYLERMRSEAELLQSSPFERYFDPAEKFAIMQALLAARDRAREEITALVIGTKREEYDRLVEEYRAREQRMDGMLAELTRLAEVSPRWRTAILDRVRTLQEGWSVVERNMDEADLREELEHWQGTLEAFLRS